MQVTRGLVGLSDSSNALHWQLMAYQKHPIENHHRKDQSRDLEKP
jgi:hypothetical protein